EPYMPSILGLNLRLPELLAAIGIAQMERIEEIMRRRRRIAEIYSQNLSNEDLVIPTEPNHVKFNWNYYTVRVNSRIDREKLIQTLNSKGVGATVYYRVPIHRTPLYQKLGFKNTLPNTELAARTVISLPIYPEMTKEDAEYVIEVLKNFLNRSLN
ncbi:MAG: pyridoxal-5'-phosphate-dependent protein, partial [Candidatus Aenigmatarchaeota archaeon]